MKIRGISAIACVFAIATSQASASSQDANQRSLKLVNLISQLLDQGGLRNINAAEKLFATNFTLQTTGRMIYGKSVVTGIVLVPQKAVTTLPYDFLYTWNLPDPTRGRRQPQVSANLTLNFNSGQCLSTEQLTRAFGANFISHDEGLTRFLVARSSQAHVLFNDTISITMSPYDSSCVFGIEVTETLSFEN